MAWSYPIQEVAAMLARPCPAVKASCQGVSTDSRSIVPGNLFFALSGENFDGDHYVAQAFEKGASAAVTTRDHAEGPCIVVEKSQTALQEFAAAHRKRHPIPLLALTGSCGKTTVKDFTAALLATRYQVVKTQGNLNNEIGCPISLLQIDDHSERAVIEMGANHSGEIARLCELARPNEAAVTLVAPAHLEGFGTVEKVARAKEEILSTLDASGRFYVNVDDPYCRAMAERFSGEKILFGSHGDVVLESCQFDADGEMVLDIAPIGRLKLPLFIQAHAMNVALAVAIALQHGVDAFEEPLREACKKASRFKVLQLGPLKILDDTYNANPASMAAALQALAARPGTGLKMAALGGMLELGESAEALHRELGILAAQCGVQYLLAMGPHACAMIEGARSAGLENALEVREHAEIAQLIHHQAKPGDALLLKGSRGFAMEKVIPALEPYYPQSPNAS